MNVSIPDWTAEGALPPLDAHNPTSTTRSPYQASLIDLVQRFGTSQERIRILDGLLRYRQGLHDVGLTRGFQWLDGSYLEDIEALEMRPPNDIDVVSFIEFPDAANQKEILGQFNDVVGMHPDARAAIKEHYHVDAYFVPMNVIPPDRLVERSSYWYSIWSHRRDETWKGFVQVSLFPDPSAREHLNRLMDQEGSQ
ncbi:hypothetical protein CKO15_11965 [Halorhodospira abdelmalekii]|uniref:DUF6932 family protein n=1 Tax=Halorhodospira abdelmalekii TaxID=421629 RepID=UPI001903EA86|nr:hypothetical protein [Halorhodospira abdelmalekii]MBK1735978.1 hypothetical protein [Halorhodospira abdelmalekii]